MERQKTKTERAEAQRCILVTAAELYGSALWIGERMKAFDQQHSVLVGGTVVALSLFAPGCASYQINQAGNPDTRPERLAQYALKEDVELTERVAANPSTPVETLLVLTASAHQATAELAAANLAVRALPPKTVLAMASSKVLNQRLAAAYRPDTPAATLAKLAADSSVAVRVCVAKNPSISYGVVLLLMDDADPQIVSLVANSDAVRKEREARLAELRKSGIAEPRLQTLAAHRLTEVRAALAAYEGLPDALRNRLVRDNQATVVDAAYQQASPQFLSALVADRDVAIRLRVAGHPQTPAAALDQLASDAEARVRTAVAGNTATPHEILYKLAADADAGVRDHLFNSVSPDGLAYFAEQPHLETRQRVAVIPRTPMSTLLKLAEDGDLDVRRIVLGNAAISPDVLAGLSDDADPAIRLAVAENPSTPASALQVLATDADSGIRKAVAGNAGTATDTMLRLAEDGDLGVRR